MEDKGLVERSRSVSDRRVVNLTLTEAGQAVATQIPEIVLNARLRKFSKAEFDELSRLLRKFIGKQAGHRLLAPEMKKGRLEADLFKNRWCPGEDSNLHDVATART